MRRAATRGPTAQAVDRPTSRGGAARGSATVLSLAIMGLTVVVMYGGLALASAVTAAHRARAAADLGALAAATSYQRGLGPLSACGVASRVVARNGARQQHCSVAGDGSVTITARCATALAFPGVARDGVAGARAGPAP
jgi:secretion/DNA translocation related TadE-like protein